MNSARLDSTFIPGQRVTFTPVQDAVNVLNERERRYVGRNATLTHPEADGKGPLLATFDDATTMVVYADELTAVTQ